MVQDRAIFATADQYKVAYGLSNGAIFNDLERPWFSTSHYFWHWISHKQLQIRPQLL